MTTVQIHKYKIYNMTTMQIQNLQYDTGIELDRHPLLAVHGD